MATLRIATNGMFSFCQMTSKSLAVARGSTRSSAPLAVTRHSRLDLLLPASFLAIRKISSSTSQRNEINPAAKNGGDVSPTKPKQVLRIYTRTGDKGTSALFSGERRPKSDPVFETLGATDELSSSIGFARELIEDLIRENQISTTTSPGTKSHETVLMRMSRQLERIQCVIQDLQSAVATPAATSRDAQKARTAWNENHLQDLEDWMDDYQADLPPLKNFIIPSGGKAGAALHMCRAISRRAERRIVPLLDRGDLQDLGILQYLNRLSSYLFTVARVAAAAAGQEEKIYIRPDSRHKSKKLDKEI